MNGKLALSLVEALGKVFLKSHIFSKVALNAMKRYLEKFKEDQEFVSGLEKVVKQGIKDMLAWDRQVKKNKGKPHNPVEQMEVARTEE